MHLTIVSPEGTQTYENITEISLPTDTGVTTIRPGHVHLTTSLHAGEMSWSTSEIVDDLASFADQTHRIQISWGIALLTDDALRVMTSNI
jgi:F0F1-type ATP synthase epsilon subunit